MRITIETSSPDNVDPAEIGHNLEQLGYWVELVCVLTGSEETDKVWRNSLVIEETP